MKIYSTFKKGRLTLFLKGELDHHGAKNALKTIDMLVDEYLPRECALDLSDISFMDSSGIAVILKVYKRLKEMGGISWVENVPKQPLRVIDASGIDRIVKVTTTVKES